MKKYFLRRYDDKSHLQYNFRLPHFSNSSKIFAIEHLEYIHEYESCLNSRIFISLRNHSHSWSIEKSYHSAESIVSIRAIETEWQERFRAPYVKSSVRLPVLQRFSDTFIIGNGTNTLLILLRSSKLFPSTIRERESLKNLRKTRRKLRTKSVYS